ncbi:MAG: high-potential iron-sulfur protein [Nevskia sp.]|nr:high-potential iron-sulfur protein [Nevskia sp.]
MFATKQVSRRRFLSLAVAAAAAPAGLLISQPSFAADLPALSPDDPAAKPLGYVADASKLDPKKETAYKPGTACATCALYSGAAGAVSGPCAIFAGKAVTAKGWCKAFAAKPA